MNDIIIKTDFSAVFIHSYWLELLMQWCRFFDFQSFFFCYLTLFCRFLGTLKLRHYEKAKKFEKKVSHVIVLTKHCFYSVSSKQVGDFFKFLWPSKKSSTLINVAINFYAQIIKLIV